MKYEEWIQYERARLEEEKRGLVERLRREEEKTKQADEQDAAEQELKLKQRGPLPPNPPPMPT